MDDWRYLTWALAEGGACIVGCPAVRAGLMKSGLMVPVPGGGIRTSRLFHKTNVMALTKKGQRRAVELRDQTSNHYDIKRAKRAINMALAKIKRSRH